MEGPRSHARPNQRHSLILALTSSTKSRRRISPEDRGSAQIPRDPSATSAPERRRITNVGRANAPTLDRITSTASMVSSAWVESRTLPCTWRTVPDSEIRGRLRYRKAISTAATRKAAANPAPPEERPPRPSAKRTIPRATNMRRSVALTYSFTKTPTGRSRPMHRDRRQHQQPRSRRLRGVEVHRHDDLTLTRSLLAPRSSRSRSSTIAEATPASIIRPLGLQLLSTVLAPP